MTPLGRKSRWCVNGDVWNLTQPAVVVSCCFSGAPTTTRSSEADEPRMGNNDGPTSHLPGSPRRADVRHTLSREIRLRFGDNGEFVTLRTLNISRRGMLISASIPPPVGTHVDVRLPLQGKSELSLTGRAVRVVRPPPGEKHFHVGIALDLDEKTQMALDRYLTATPGAESGERLPDIPHERKSAPAPEPPEVDLEKVDRKATLAKIQLKRVMAAHLAKEAAPKRPAEPILGIDLGTSTCVACILQGDELTMVRDEAGHVAIPSVVWCRDKGDVVVGREAKEQMPLEPVRTIPAIRRLLGLRGIDRNAAQFLQSIGCPVRACPDHGVVFIVNGEELSPIHIAATILRHVRECGERAIDRPIRKAVLSYALAAGAEGKEDLEQAARLAGLEPIEMIPEAVAVSLAYGCGQNSGIFGVYDFGGGSFTFSVVESVGGSLKVCGASSDPWLGGEDMDLAVARASANEFWRVAQLDLRQRIVEWRRLIHAAEETKQILSMVEGVEISVPRVALTTHGGIDLSVPLTRRWFNELTTDLVYNTWRVAQRGLADAAIPKDQLSDLLLAGGASKVPSVRDSAQALYGRAPHPTAHPDRAAAIGAALKAISLADQPLPPGPWPDLVEATTVAQTIGLAMAGGVTEPLIPRSTALPAVVRRIFATFRDGQTRLTVQIVAGEERATSANKVVGTVQVIDLPEGPAGSAEVEVTFEMNDPASLSVRTRNLCNGRHKWTAFQLAW